jgi:hypothetical protein
MSWQNQLHGDSLTWLTENENPGLRYLALRDLCDIPNSDPILLHAQEIAHQQGPIAQILDQMNIAGYWSEPGPGYGKKYFSTLWSIILLAQLGASSKVDPRIIQACNYLFENTMTSNGQFSMSGAPSGTVDCLQGNLCASLTDLEIVDPRLEDAIEWMARSVTGEGISSSKEKHAVLRYYASKCGPNFMCGGTNKLPCAWGAIKVMRAFGKLTPDQRSPLIKRAINQGVEYLLGTDPLDATYPNGLNEKPSGNWWKFGFPVFYVTDLLQNLEALIRLGYGKDPRISKALHYVIEKQDHQGRWALEYDYKGKTWIDFGEKKLANPWVTYRALWVLKNSFESAQE